MENEKSLLRLSFGDTYQTCKTSGADDDRLLFIREIQLLMDALDAMKDVVNSMIRISFHKEFNKRYKELEELEKSLKERNMV